MKNLLLVVLVGAPLCAAVPKPHLSCDEKNFGHNNRLTAACEMREQTSNWSGGTMSIDARDNGGISVHGWDRTDVQVRAQVITYAVSQSEAQQFAKQVQVQLTGSEIKAAGPKRDNDHQWNVSYEVYLPRAAAMALKTTNGGISVEETEGKIQFEAVNGGINLNSVAGALSGKTVNGGINVVMNAQRWHGDGIDVKTTNGGINVKAPENLSASVELSTVNGGIASNLVKIERNETPHHGPQRKTIKAEVGRGGPMLRASTMNGGINLSKQ